jgi:peroxiredoxin (alkyl hydroperoxide reductase subunit C)
MDYEIMMNSNVKIGQYAPEFEAQTTQGTIKLSDYRGKWVLFFSHPGDFTPVCTTEIIGFAKAEQYFKNLNVELIGLSIDSNASHLEWINQIYKKTGTYVKFPIIADRNGEIARKYGMISNDISKTETVRNVFLIDDKGFIRIIFVYPMQIGRSIPEILRSIEAIQTADNCNAVTPLNWTPGDPVIQYAPNTFEGLMQRQKEISENKNGMSWYLSFKDAIDCEKNQKCKIME